MLRMIRSARSRLGREQLEQGNDASLASGCSSSAMGHERASSVGSSSLQSGSNSRWYEIKLGHECEQPSDFRPQRRVGGNARPTLGGRQRLARSRSTADPLLSRGSENQATQLPPTLASAPLGVLSDVTNTTGNQAQGPKPSFGAILKPVGAPLGAAPRDLPGLSHPTLAPVSLLPPASSKVATPAATPPQSPGLVESDVAHSEDPQHVVEYISDIYRNMQEVEADGLPESSYMDKQPHVNSKMRAILVDWLVDVHKKYKLGSLTLFLCVSIIDRYLEKRTTARRHLQLVGVTALLIAAKFEEQYPPQIHDFVYVTDKAYSKDEVIKMEVSMLTALDFKVCLATPMHFLERYQIVNGCTDAHRDLTNYLLELTLVDYKMVKYNPSHLAAAAVLLSNKLLRRTPSWSGAAVRHTQMTEQTLKECAKEMCGILEHAESHALQAVRKKYSQLKHHAVAKLNFSSTSGSTLAEDARRAARRSTQRRGSAPMELTPAPAAGSTLRQSGQDSTSLLSECGMMA